MSDKASPNALYPWLEGANVPLPERRVAGLQGSIAGMAFRLAELRMSGASRRIIEREERGLSAYRRMLEEAEKA